MLRNPVAVEKLAFSEESQNLSDRKCLGEVEKSFVELPDAKQFLRNRSERVFQQPRLITTVRNPRSTEALEVGLLQQLGRAPPWLASDREFPDPLLSRQLSCNLFAVQRVSLSSGLTRSTDDMGGEA